MGTFKSSISEIIEKHAIKAACKVKTTLAARLKPSELREYTNLLDSSIGHYSDWLKFERRKSNAKVHSDLIKFRRRFRK